MPTPATTRANPTCGPKALRSQWRRAYESLPAQRTFNELRTFGRYCADAGVPPEAIDEATIVGYADRLAWRARCDVDKRVAQLRWQLNAAHTDGAGWPGPAVAAPAPPDRTHRHQPLSAFPPAFQVELARLETELHAPSQTPPQRTHSVVAPSTARQITKRVRESASRLAAIGALQLTALREPADLLTPARLEALFTDLRDRVAPTHLRNYAKTFITVCHVALGRGSDAERRVRAYLRATPVESEALDGTPTDTLLQLIDTPAADRLTAFPDRALDAAAVAGGALARQAWAKAGAAVTLGLSAPLWPRELCALQVGDVAPAGAADRVTVPGATGADAYPLPPAAGARLDRHIAHLPNTGPDAPLFPGRRADEATSPQSLATLFERTLQPHVGLPITPRVLYLRHLALLLRDDPADVARVLTWARLTGSPLAQDRLRQLAQTWRPHG